MMTTEIAAIRSERNWFRLVTVNSPLSPRRRSTV